MNEAAFLNPLKTYFAAFAERDPVHRADLLSQCLTPDAEIWGPKRVFAGYVEISEKIAGFHQNWPGCCLVLASGVNSFKNAALIGNAIVGADDTVRASGQSVVELANDGRICRVLAFWEPLPSLPASWPESLAVPVRRSNPGAT